MKLEKTLKNTNSCESYASLKLSKENKLTLSRSATLFRAYDINS